jgi:pyruvate dehydrogenase E2 component (dihydrolipoamide acetyltransferase)
VTGPEVRLSSSGARIAETIPLVGVKRLIAKHMVDSHIGVPSVTIMEEFNVDALVDLRNMLNEMAAKDGIAKISYTHLLVKFVASSLRLHRLLNSTLVDAEIQILEDINIGVAVALDNGDLVVPVIRNADQLSIPQIAMEANRLAIAARQRRLTPQDVRGGTFTLTNIGVVPETRWQTPIVNAPQCAILAAGAVRQAPVIRNSAITIGHVMSVSLSFDHRIVSGHPAALFLKAFDAQLQDFGKGARD